MTSTLLTSFQKTVDRASDEHSSHSNISVPKVNAFSQTDQTDDFLKEKITTLEENFNIIDAKFQSYQDQVKNKTNELTRRIAALESEYNLLYTYVYVYALKQCFIFCQICRINKTEEN